MVVVAESREDAAAATTIIDISATATDIVVTTSVLAEAYLA